MNKKSVHGFTLVDKEKGVSSFFVLKQLKARLVKQGVDVKKLKIGHAGTLDPIATGLLIVAFGEATKLLEYVVGQDKVYEAECVLGAVTDTYDADGEIVYTDTKNDGDSKDGTKKDGIKKDSWKEITPALIKKVVQRFTGEIDQIPPKFSAKKIDGVAAYKLARAGKDLEMKSCKVRVDEIDVLKFKWPVLKMKVKCSSGTYIRSLIHDIGQVLSCGAYMTELRRGAIGDFDVDDAVKVDDFFVANISSIESSFGKFPSIDFDEEDMDILNRGNFVDARENLLSKFQENDGVFLGRYNEKIFAVLERVNISENLDSRSSNIGSCKIKVKKKLNVFV